MIYQRSLFPQTSDWNQPLAWCYTLICLIEIMGSLILIPLTQCSVQFRAGINQGRYDESFSSFLPPNWLSTRGKESEASSVAPGSPGLASTPQGIPILVRFNLQPLFMAPTKGHCGASGGRAIGGEGTEEGGKTEERCSYWVYGLPDR